MYKSLVASTFTILLVFLYLSNNTNNNHFEVQTKYDESQTTGVFNNKPVTIPPYLSTISLPPKVLGDNTATKKIYVDLTSQRLYAYENDDLIYSFLVSTGKYGKTPTGNFNIWGKFRSVKMSGGSKALHTYYYLPNVPYTLFFSNKEVASTKGFSIHGAYWHNNFGHPMSHGCINMKISEAALIYDWANPELLNNNKSEKATPQNLGTEVIIYGTAPNS